MAVSKACTALIRSQDHSRAPMTLRFIEASDGLDISVEARHSGAHSALRSLGARPTCRRGELAGGASGLTVWLIQGLMDEVCASDGDGGTALRLRKKQRERTNGGPSSAR